MAAVPENLRYSIITIKNPREIVLLRGTGCQWRRCRFCDYHLDFSHDMADNEALNRRVLSLVSGKYGVLECINSGSFVDLGTSTLEDIRTLCVDKKIGTIHFESHWMHREQIAPLREYFLQKDIKVYPDKLNDVGIMAYPLDFMSPKLPGLGDVDWGKYVSALTDIGYDSYTCIEIEDKAFEGSTERIIDSLRISYRYMRQFVI